MSEVFDEIADAKAKVYRGVKTKVRDKHTHPLHHVFMGSAKRLRERLNYTQADVAEKIGMDVQKYSRLERTVNFCPITMDEAYKISTALESSVLAMTFSNRMESWLHDIHNLMDQVENTTEALQVGMDALKGVKSVMAQYEDQMQKERKDFSLIDEKYQNPADTIVDSHGDHDKTEIDQVRHKMARPNVIE